MESKEQTPDQKLREAANNYSDSKLSCFLNWYNGSKSDAAREYWEAQRPKIDVDALHQKFFEWCHLQDRNKLTIDETFNFFLPHLQPESDAVEFTKWKERNYTAGITDDRTGSLYMKVKSSDHTWYNLQSIYAEFKQSKF